MPAVRIGPVVFNFPEEVTYYDPMPNVSRVKDVFTVEDRNLVIHRTIKLNTPLTFIRIDLGRVDEHTQEIVAEGCREFAERRIHGLQVPDEGEAPIQEGECDVCSNTDGTTE